MTSTGAALMAQRPGVFNHVLCIPDGHRRHARRTKAQLADTYRASSATGLMFLRVLEELLHPGIISFYVVAIRNLTTRDEEEIADLWDGVLCALQTIANSEELMSGQVAFRAIGERCCWPSEVGALVDQLAAVYNQEARYRLQFLLAYSGDLDTSRALRQVMSDMSPGADGNPLELVQSRCEFSENVDLVVRTGGSMRLTDGPFLPCRRAEFLLVNKPFPLVNKQELVSDIERLLSATRAAQYNVREVDLLTIQAT